MIDMNGGVIMALRFRKSFKIAPGVKFNVGKKSAGISIGNKFGGVSFNTKTGARARASAPGTGVSYTSKIGGKPMRAKGVQKADNQKVKKPFYKRWWFMLVVALLVVGAIGSVFDDGNDDASISAPVENVTPSTVQAPENALPEEATAQTSGDTKLNHEQPDDEPPDLNSNTAPADPQNNANPEPATSAQETPAQGANNAVDESKGKYVASSESDKYHTPNCRWAKKIIEENAIWFDTAEAAQKSGYSACGTCNPK